jgi:endonuclease G
MLKPIVRSGLIALCSLLLTGCLLLDRPVIPTTPHLLLGNPSRAIADPQSADNFLMIKPQYALSYNNSQRIPNWVSWQLNASHLGTVPRGTEFRPDDSLPPNWHAVVPSEYNGSGYDRGHMIPSADRTATSIDNAATFLMTNILPQTPDNNQGPWADLENYCRNLARQGKELYIVAGGYGKKAPIARGTITPPSRLWKAIVVLNQPGQGLTGITPMTRTIAVDMPNAQGIRETDWQTFRVSIAQLEAKTGYRFLSNLSPVLQNELKQRTDQQ